MENKSFSGFRTAITSDWKEKFDELYNDDGQAVFVSKNVFHHEDEMSFDYRYIINAIDMYSATGWAEGSNYISIRLYIMPEVSYWSDKALKDAAKLNGWENESIDALKEMLNAQDAISCGYIILCGDDAVYFDEKEYEDGFYDVLDNPEVIEKMNVIASAMEMIDACRGYAIDAAWNLLGTTGWDTLEEVLKGKDAIYASINRIKK